jgi:hypothetical protein
VHHGFTALRHNSIFCSNTIDQAFQYGGDARRRFYILPKNGFEYTWYGDAHDLYSLNFSATLGREDLPIDELMKMAQPRHDGIEDMLNTYRHHELHFTGDYWALDYDYFGQLMNNELFGQGVAVHARYGRLPPEVRKACGFKVA